MKFGEKVRDLRKKHSLTQDELAKCLGVSKRTVIGWERDGRYPRNVEILEKMADIFHVPLTYIQQKKAGPSAWICTTSYLPNALQSAAKKEELTAASPPDVKIGTKNSQKKQKNKPHKAFLTIL